MNTFTESQIENLKMYLKSFLQGCRMSAIKNDGIIDNKERDQLNKIEKATKDYILQLEKIIKK